MNSDSETPIVALSRSEIALRGAVWGALGGALFVILFVAFSFLYSLLFPPSSSTMTMDLFIIMNGLVLLFGIPIGIVIGILVGLLASTVMFAYFSRRQGKSRAEIVLGGMFGGLVAALCAEGLWTLSRLCSYDYQVGIFSFTPEYFIYALVPLVVVTVVGGWFSHRYFGNRA